MNASDLAQLSSRMSRFQHSFVGICVALLLSGGLVSVPASCECGASIAHGHSLFTLPGHHHGTDGWIADDSQPDTLRANQLSIEVHAQSDPQVTAFTRHGAGRLALALADAPALSMGWQRFSSFNMASAPGEDHIDTPDAPPPQQPDQGKHA